MEFLTIENVVKVLEGGSAIVGGFFAWRSRKSSQKADKAEKKTAISAAGAKEHVELLQEKIGEIDRLTVQIRQLEAKVQLQDQELNSMRNSHTVLQGDFVRATRLLDEVQQERDTLMNRIKQLEDRLALLESKLREAEDKNSTLSLELKAKINENLTLKDEMEKLLIKINSLEGQLRISFGL